MKHFRKLSALPLLLVLTVVLHSQNLRADLTVYTNSQNFESALTSNGLPLQTLTFEQFTAPITLSDPAAIGTVTFTGFGPPDLTVDNQFATTSGQNYLGADDPNSANLFFGGYEIDMQFATSNAIGLFLITSEMPGLSIFDDDIELTVPGIGSVFLDVDSIESTLVGGDRVFFIGLIDTMQNFSSAQIRYSIGAFESVTFNIDDVKTAIDALLGDVNRDGVVNLLDIEPFIDLLSGGGYQIEADINQDGVVNLIDIEPFVDLLSG